MCEHKWKLVKTTMEVPEVSNNTNFPEVAYLMCEKCGAVKKEIIQQCK